MESFEQALKILQPSIQKYSDGDIEILRGDLWRILKYDLKVSINSMSFSELTGDDFADKMALTLANEEGLIIGGHTLNEAEYQNIVSNLVEIARSNFRKSVIANEHIFREALIKETQLNAKTIKAIGKFMTNNFDLVLSNFEDVNIKLDNQSNQLQQISTTISKMAVTDDKRINWINPVFSSCPIPKRFLGRSDEMNHYLNS